jgi:serine/threonine-protein kinase RsbW
MNDDRGTSGSNGAGSSILAADAELVLEFPAKPEYVGAARHAVSALARLHEFPDDVTEDLKIAVSEACTNAVAANAGASPAPSVKVRGWSSDPPAAIVVEVLDRGPGLDPSLVEREAELDSEEFSFERGLSLPLIKALVDSLEIRPREGGGSMLRMRVLAEGRDAGAGAPNGEESS